MARYRHIDTAEVYANDHGVGEELRVGPQQAGIERGDVFLITRLWPQT
ncbi:hypothetical protein [Streptomyces parvulus]